ncbi:hypothetical protein HK102_002004 [Quaeritorhiza haematococci]|nr:hypothetical protein HK102_002004 [Quaeritorhiza haematococci]
MRRHASLHIFRPPSEVLFSPTSTIGGFEYPPTPPQKDNTNPISSTFLARGTLKSITSTTPATVAGVLAKAVEAFKGRSAEERSLSESSEGVDLCLAVEDDVIILDALPDGFAFGMNKTTKKFGFFPLNMVDIISDENNPDGIIIEVPLPA